MAKKSKLYAAVTFFALLSAVSGTSAVAEQSATPPALAQDGQGLFGQAPETRAMFNGVWSDQAPVVWIQEHDAGLSGGKPPTGPRIGVLYGGSASANFAFTEGLASGLRTVGYHPGQDISIIWRFADGHPELLPAMAAEFAQLPVDLIVAPVVNESLAAKQATSTIPIVTMTVGDPVGLGLADSLEHPGGNITGVILQPLEFNVERLAFLKEAVPSATRIAVLTTPGGVGSPALKLLQDSAPGLGLEIQTIEWRSADELPGAFASAVDQAADAMLVFPDTLVTANRSRIVQLATETAFPRCIQATCSWMRVGWWTTRTAKRREAGVRPSM